MRVEATDLHEEHVAIWVQDGASGDEVRDELQLATEVALVSSERLLQTSVVRQGIRQDFGALDGIAHRPCPCLGDK
eukprot:scaffold178_cov255-Pinguiococcus_pyrenoidosus.AAC.25